MSVPNKKTRLDLESEVAKELGLRYGTVAEVVNFQFKFVHRMMATGMMYTIRLPYMGSFSVSAQAAKRVMKLKARKINEELNNSRREGESDSRSGDQIDTSVQGTDTQRQEQG